MTNLQIADNLAQRLREESFSFRRNNCLHKCIRLRRQLWNLGIPSRLLLTIGTSKAEWFGLSLPFISCHFVLDVGGNRIETARALDERDAFGIRLRTVKPYIGIWF